MKIRSVRPEFFADPTMAELPYEARLLYIGLWCYVDDDGRGEWLPKQIDGLIFPLENVDIHALLEQLVRSARIVRYSDGDRDYFHIPTFTEYQRPNRKYDSKLPDPAECQAVEPLPPQALPTQRVRTADAHAVEGEGEGVREPIGSRDDTDRIGVWTALEDLFGEPAETDRKLRGKVLRSLLRAGATHSEVHRRAEAWPKLFPASGGGRVPTLTATALEKHWGQLGKVSDVSAPFDPDECAHPEGMRAVVDDAEFCGVCRRELHVV